MREQLVKKTPLTGYSAALRLGAVGLARSMMRRNNAGRNQFYRSGRNSIRGASRARQRSGRTRTLQRRRGKSASSGLGVTTQHDARLIYQKSSMPSFKKRKWKAFKNKVLAVAEKDLGTLQFMFNVLINPANSTPSKQCLNAFYLYGNRSAAASYCNDMFQMTTDIKAADMTTGKGLPVASSSKVIFQSAVLDLTIRNDSRNNGLLDSAGRMEVDVYEISMRHSGEEQGTTYASFEGILAMPPTF